MSNEDTTPQPGARVCVAFEGTLYEQADGSRYVMLDPDRETGEVFGIDVHPHATVTVVAEVPADKPHADTPRKFHVGQFVRWQYPNMPEWFTARLDNHDTPGGHDWHGLVVDPGSYPDARAGDDMWLMEFCLTEVPAAVAADQPAKDIIVTAEECPGCDTNGGHYDWCQGADPDDEVSEGAVAGEQP